MARTWSYRKRKINVLAPKRGGIAAAVWAYIVFTTVFLTILTCGVIYLCTHAPKEDDSTPITSGKIVPPNENGG